MMRKSVADERVDVFIPIPTVVFPQGLKCHNLERLFSSQSCRIPDDKAI